MSNNIYRCSVCNRAYEYKGDRDYHEEYEHNSKLSDYDVKGFSKLEAMTDALRMNDYDSKDVSDDSIQKTLKNEPVSNNNIRRDKTRQNQLKDF